MERVGYEADDEERGPASGRHDGHAPATGRLDATFMALADPTRRAIIRQLRDGEATVTELARPFAMSQPAISKHLKVLERAGLVSRRRDAQRRPCRLEPRQLKAANDWLDGYRSYWDESFGRLDAVLDDMAASDDGRSSGDAGPGSA
jgi:DNA-binding transcriptional ArsR family regulator